MIPMSTANRRTWTTHIHNKPNVWKNSAPQERPLNSKLTLHTNAQAHTIYIYIFSLFQEHKCTGKYCSGRWRYGLILVCVTHFFFLFHFTQTLQSRKKKKNVDVVGLQCITQRMPERQFYSLKVMWVTVTVGDHRTLWMPSHLWQCPLLRSQVYRVLENYMYEKGFHCLPGFANPQMQISVGICSLPSANCASIGRDFRSRSRGLWQTLSRQMVFTNAGSPSVTPPKKHTRESEKKVKIHQDINCIRSANAIHTATTHQ